eukprot:TRINITY_DN1852_c0_g1_i2.p1 TRINITY_DN1852_c0_g1~~TRINITY_DN1852_c0_g1_i2.p1  ORF type:complete len:217 (-),score=26.28 TRINITY_DN1852_c0_g1_i2:13-663(-)
MRMILYYIPLLISVLVCAVLYALVIREVRARFNGRSVASNIFHTPNAQFLSANANSPNGKFVSGNDNHLPTTPLTQNMAHGYKTFDNSPRYRTHEEKWKHEQAVARRAITSVSFYMLVFVVCSAPALFSSILALVDPGAETDFQNWFWLFATDSALSSMQGFLNSLVYGLNAVTISLYGDLFRKTWSWIKRNWCGGRNEKEPINTQGNFRISMTSG